MKGTLGVKEAAEKENKLYLYIFNKCLDESIPQESLEEKGCIAVLGLREDGRC